MKPTRRQVLRYVGLGALAILVGSAIPLGRALQRRRIRYRRADDLAPIPWLGHC